MKVKDVMHKGVECGEPDAPLTTIAKIMRDADVGSVPVCGNDKLAGMVTDRDIVVRGLAGSADCTDLTAAEVMSSPVVYCHADEDVEDALHIMEKNQIRRLPVVDENQRLIGMLALGDITMGCGRDLSGEVLKSVAAHHA